MIAAQRDDNDDDFLDQPFARASLRDHGRSVELRENRRFPFQPAAQSFLGVAGTEIVRHFSEYRLYDVPQITLSLETCFPEWRLVTQAGASRDNYWPWTPAWTQFEQSPGVYREAMREGTWFFELPDGQRRILSLDEASGPDRFLLTAICRAADEPILLKELNRLRAHIDENHYLKGTTIDVAGKRFPPGAKLTWDDVFLADDVRHAVQTNVRQFLALREVFAKNGVPCRRGMLLYGPPGNGKTLIGKVLRSTEPATFMYVTAGDADNAAALREAFALARRLKPTIVFLEDLDMYAAERGSTPDCRALGEILAQLDGMQDNDGLMVIATTNDLTVIEPALRDRPNRFDVVIEVGPPDAAARRRILYQRLAKTTPQEDNLLDEAVALTGGFSGAQVQEAAWRIIQHAIIGGSLDANGIARLTQRDLELTLPASSQNGSARRRIGFGQKGSRNSRSEHSET